jgi:Icc protein
MKSDSEPAGVTKVTPHPKSRQIINILQITDTHLFASHDGCLLGLNTEQSLKAVIADIRAQQFPADIILATGDLVHDGTSAAYRRVFAHLEAFNLPVYCLPGNHDEAGMLQRTIKGNLLHYTTHVQRGNWNLVFLDSCLPGSEGGHLGSASLTALETHLQRAPDCYTLVCLHHQPVLMGSRWLDTMAVDNAGEFFKIVDRYPQVRGILWGHVHQEFDSMHGNIRLLASPSTCIQFLPGSSNFAVAAAAPGYRWLSLYPEGRIETGIHRLSQVPGSVDMASGGYK